MRIFIKNGLFTINFGTACLSFKSLHIISPRNVEYVDITSI
jgi:hypothetical protein